jgi:Porin PorA
MRRHIGAVLVGLGVLLIVLALTVPTWVGSHVLKFPLNFYYSADLVSPNTTYFNPSTLSEVNGATVEGIATLKGDAAAGNSSTAVWNQFSVLRDTGTGQNIQIQSRTVAFDRKTAALVNCCGQNLNGKPVNVSGAIAGFVFPIGTQQQTYDVFDTTAMKPEPFSYAGTDTVNGISTYKFTEYLFPTNIGFSALSSTEPEFYGVDLTYWIDPETGVLLKIVEHEQLFLEDPNSGATTTVLFDGTLTQTPASVAAIVAIDGSGRLKITVVHLIIPLVAGILGLVLLVWGFLLFGQGSQPEASESGFEAMTRELTGRAQDDGQASPAAGGGKHAAGSQRPDSIVPGLEAEPTAASADRPGGDDPEAGPAQ